MLRRLSLSLLSIFLALAAPAQAAIETSAEQPSPDTSAPDNRDRAVATGATPPVPAPMATAADARATTGPAHALEY